MLLLFDGPGCSSPQRSRLHFRRSIPSSICDIFDRAKSRVGFAVAKNGDSANPNELIATVGSSSSENGASSEAASGAQNGAVDLHLDSGLMGGDGGSSDDSSSDEATTTTTTAAPVETFKPSDDTGAATNQAMSAALSGEASMSDDDTAPLATTTTTQPAAVDGSAIDVAAAIDGTPTQALDSSPAPSTTEAYQAAAADFGDAWFHAGEDASTTAAPAVDATTTPSTGGYGDVAADYFKQDQVATTTAAAAVDDAPTSAPAATTTLNAIDSMRKMLAGSLLQTHKAGNNLVSVKLHRY